MLSSAHYKKVMNDISAKKKEIETKKKKYESIEGILKGLSLSLTKPIDNLRSAEENFESGGYYVGGQTPANGALEKSAEKLLDAQEELETVIQKTTDDIDEFNVELEKLARQLESATYNYKKAIKQEMME